eukprot:GHVN01077974.1.p1 GENE.GHVN01077974.1~~GHVN01077974.1.p1  ORF type:complete len:103 (-),score=8.77 GHVN01077974.1:370-678(-)
MCYLVERKLRKPLEERLTRALFSGVVARRVFTRLANHRARKFCQQLSKVCQPTSPLQGDVTFSNKCKPLPINLHLPVRVSIVWELNPIAHLLITLDQITLPP